MTGCFFGKLADAHQQHERLQARLVLSLSCGFADRFFAVSAQTK